jgi:hypothetical protein
MRHAAPRRRRVQRNPGLVRGSCPNLQQGRQKAKDPVACGLPGLVDLRRPSLRTWGSRKAVQRHRHATHPPLLRGSSTCLARSGTASSNFSCEPSCESARVVSHWHFAAANLGSRETNTAPANRQQKALHAHSNRPIASTHPTAPSRLQRRVRNAHVYGMGGRTELVYVAKSSQDQAGQYRVNKRDNCEHKIERRGACPQPSRQGIGSPSPLDPQSCRHPGGSKRPRRALECSGP